MTSILAGNNLIITLPEGLRLQFNETRHSRSKGWGIHLIAIVDSIAASGRELNPKRLKGVSRP